tara:strand:+ start:441 stop:1100 length:660 start_codon:yes stop_codon:yes gene_type:complete
MTQVKLHGILAKEFGDTFALSVGNPRNVLDALDCNKRGFISRLIELQKEGFLYQIIVDKTVINTPQEMANHEEPQTIDLVPAIVGSGFLAPIIGLFTGGGFLATIAKAVLFAAISYALTPKPEVEALEITADGSKESLIFSNTANVASQGAPLPVGYGRLIVGSQVVQATIKSFPQGVKTKNALRNVGVTNRDGSITPVKVGENSNSTFRTNKVVGDKN